MMAGCWPASIAMHDRIEDHFERRLTEMSERDAIEVPVHP